MRTRFLSGTARLVTKHPKWVLLSSVIITGISIFLAATRLQMNTDQDDLVSEKIEYHKRYKDYLREFGDLEYLYVVVESGNGAEKEFIKALSTKLEKLPDVREVTYQISNPKLEKSFLLYLPVEQLKAIGEFLPKMQEIGSVADVFRMMNQSLVTSVDDNQRLLLETGFRFLDKLLDGMIAFAKNNAPYKPFMQEAFFGGEKHYDEEGFLLSDTGKLFFIMIMPEKNYKTLAVIDEPLKKIRSALDETRKEFPGVRAGLTGRPVLAADEMRTSDEDMTIATIAALFIVTLIFILYFRRLTRPVMAAVALMAGIAQTFGLTTVVIGHLNILSIVFAVILIGAGIEFGLQIVSRYREELAHHKNARLAVESAITQTGRGNVTACLTTAAAFFAACCTNFLALQELGFIAGTGIILCLANMLTTLPAMIYLRDKGKNPDKLHTALKIRLDFLEKIYARPKIVLLTAGVFTLLFMPALFYVKFNHNLLDLQARGLESVEYEKKIINESSQSTWYVPLVAENREASLELAEKVRALPSVGRVETVADAVPDGQGKKMKLIDGLKSASPKPMGSRALARQSDLRTELQKFQQNIAHLSEMAFSAGEAEAVNELEKISKKVDDILSSKLPAEEFEQAFISDLHQHINILRSGFHPETIELEDMPPSIQRRYKSEKSGRFQIYVYPKEDVWKPHAMAEFIKDVRSVDPNATGTPVEVYESSRLLEKSFKTAALLALFAIIIIVAVDFRDFRLAIFALTPLMLGILWLFELMGLFGIRFNLANFFGIPILIGVGVDNAVQIAHRFKAHGESGIVHIMTYATGTAVLLTSITTIASFGTLAFARHMGIASLGLIMSLGTITCFIGSMIILPCILKIYERY